MPDLPPRPFAIETAAPLTLREASRLSGRPLSTLRRWTELGQLPFVYADIDGRKTKLVTVEDVATTSRERRRWGLSKTRPRPLTTVGGKTIVLHGQARTDSWEEG